MDTKILTAALSMDLLRVAIGLHQGSLKMAERFREEALKLSDSLENMPCDDYLKRLVRNSKKVLNRKDDKVAEDALMYSVLLQNFAVKKL